MESVDYKPVELAPHTEIPGREDSKGFPFDKLSGKFSRISPDHARAYVDRVISSGVVWGDEFGNIFTSTGIKGLPPTNEWPFVEKNEGSIGGMRTHFLIDHDDPRYPERLIKLSQALREKGLEVERIRKVSKLESVTIDSQEMTIEELKEKLIKKGSYLFYPQDESQPPYEITDSDTLEQYLSKAVYWVVERDQQVGERMADLNTADLDPGKYLKADHGKYYYNDKEIELNTLETQATKENNKELAEIVEFAKNHPDYGDTGARIIGSGEPLRKVLDKIKPYLNAKGIKHYFETTDGIVDFFYNTLPSEMGKNLGEWHKQNVVHGNTIITNWLATGKLTDIETAKGFLDQKLEVGDFKKDLLSAQEALAKIFGEKYVNVYSTNLSGMPDFYLGYLYQTLGPEKYQQKAKEALVNFLANYLKSSGKNIDYLKDSTSEAVGETQEETKKIDDILEQVTSKLESLMPS